MRSLSRSAPPSRPIPLLYVHTFMKNSEPKSIDPIKSQGNRDNGNFSSSHKQAPSIGVCGRVSTTIKRTPASANTLEPAAYLPDCEASSSGVKEQKRRIYPKTALLPPHCAIGEHEIAKPTRKASNYRTKSICEQHDEAIAAAHQLI